MEISAQEKIEAVLEHIQNVQRNCYRLGLKLIKKGEVELGRMLIANGQIHDNSKFKGIEFDHLFYGDPLLMDVVKHHSSTNSHHPECWGGIQKMPDVYIAEMVCDCAARSAEFGTDLRKWFSESATKKYNFEMTDEDGLRITRFIDILLSPSFK
jgi:hypothetical protein